MARKLEQSIMRDFWLRRGRFSQAATRRKARPDRATGEGGDGAGDSHSVSQR